MKVAGFALRNVLHKTRLELEAAYRMFDSSLHAFADETEKNPVEEMKRIEVLEDRAARLETAQQQFNLNTIVDFDGKKQTLAYVIKHVGGRGRMAKKWREIAAPKKERSYSYDDGKTRDNTKETAKPTVTVKAALAEHLKQDALAMQARNAISAGNSQEFETELVTADDLGVS